MSDQLLTEIRDLLKEANAMTKKSVDHAEEVMAMSRVAASRTKTLSRLLKIFLGFSAVVILAQALLS